MSDFRFYSEGKDKFHNVIRLGDIIVYAGGTQSESNVAFAFVTSIRKDYSWGTTKCIIGYSPINEDLKGFRKQGNNKSKWGDSIIKVPKEWIGRFDYVRSKFNKEHFKKEIPTQDEIDAYFREKEYDEYQQIHRLGKYAPNPKKIDRREWKMLLSDAIQETATLPFSYTKKIIVECKKEGRLSSLWNDAEPPLFGSVWASLKRNCYAKYEKDFKSDSKLFIETMWKLFQELVNDWENER